MSQRPSRISRFLRELKRRKIYRVAVTYGAVGLALTEAASHVFEALLFPPWAHRLFVVMVIFGFPVALVLAWAFEVTPDGVRRAAPASATGAEGEEEGGAPGRAGEGGSVEGSAGSGAPDGVFARHGRTIAFGIAAGLITVVAIGLWTAGDQADVPPEEHGDRAARVDSAAAGSPTERVPSPDSADDPGAKASTQGAAQTVRKTGETPGGRPVARAGSESPEATEPGSESAAGANPAQRGAEPDPAHADAGPDQPRTGGEPERARDGARPEATTYRGVAVLIDGEAHPGHRTTENVILEQLAAEGFHVLDRTSLELQSALPGESASKPGQLGRRIGARAVVIGSYRASASPSVGGFYTGSATLSVRTYDTRSGRLLSSKTYRVGGGGTPGKMGNTADAAATEAAEQVGYQAARALARELERVRAEDDRRDGAGGG